MSAGAIWLADVARVLARLDPRDERARESILALLGLRLGDGKPPATPPQPEPEPEPPAPRPPPPAPIEDPSRRPSGTAARPTSMSEPQSEPEELIPPMPSGAREPLPSWTTVPLGQEPAAPATLTHRSLLRPRAERQMLLALASQPVAGRELDLDVLVERIAAGEPVAPLAYLNESRLAFRLQVLVDRAESMQPFQRDQQELTAELRRAVGAAAIAEVGFRNAPLRGSGSGRISSWEEYRPPPRGAPVLALTDLGIGGPRMYRDRARPEEWLELAALLRARGSRLIALVPYPARRWPDELRRDLRIVVWDRTTSMSRLLARLAPEPWEEVR